MSGAGGNKINQALLFLATHPSVHLNKDHRTYSDVPIVQVGGKAPANTNHYIVCDPNATITIENDRITVTYFTCESGSDPILNTFQESGYTGNLPGPDKRAGKLYFIGNGPAPGLNCQPAPNDFWFQEFPPYEGDTKGRINVEFWNNQEITAVFKTNDGNEQGRLGDGEWSSADFPPP